MIKKNKKPLTKKKAFCLSLLYLSISFITLGIMILLGPILNISFSNETVDVIFSLFLIFIAGGAVASYGAQLLFSSMVGSTVGIMDGLGMLFTAKAATAGMKAGTLGILGVGKGLLLGKNKVLGKGISGNGNSPGLVTALKTGGIAKTASFATKATVGSVLTTAGFIGGSIGSLKTVGLKETTKRAGKQVIKPVTKVGNIVKTKVSDSYNVGFNKHIPTKANPTKMTKKEIKQDIKANIQQNKEIKKNLKKGKL